MNKSTKGAIASAVAAVLLLGGGGTLAYWNASTTGTGVKVAAGELKIVDSDCEKAAWYFDEGEVEPGKEYIPGKSLIVPGDTLTKSCAFGITATGDHLRAKMAVTNPKLEGDLTKWLEVGSTFEFDGAAMPDEITEADNGKKVKAQITLHFMGPDSGNETQTLSAALSDFEISLTQVHN